MAGPGGPLGGWGGILSLTSLWGPCRRSSGRAASYLNASPAGKDAEEEGEVLNKGAFF